jgi:hypothetical protein
VKNYRTPRTLADSTFVVGYRNASQRQSKAGNWLAAVFLGLVVGVLLAIGV